MCDVYILCIHVRTLAYNRDSDRMSRKRRHGYDDESVATNKRDKAVMPSGSKRGNDPR